MASNGFDDEQLDFMCEDFFDNIEDLLDFPLDDEALGMVDSSFDAGEQVDSISILTSNGEGCRVTTNSEKNKLFDSGINEDWISKFLGDTDLEIELPANNAIISTSCNDYMDKDGSLFQSFSPVSVLEPSNLNSGDNSGSSSSSSSSSSNFVSLVPLGPTLVPVPTKARTKRPRHPAQTLRAILLPKCDNIVKDSCTKTMQKKQKRSLAGLNACAEDATSARRCIHCGLEKTPQWRVGPMGPKTLCNACGVRYRSGRLYPEYRPAASPTFVPALHSNSHKKVVEMRNKDGEKNALKNWDLLEYVRRRD